MRIKSYFARTVEEAMARARQELGPEAMLMNSRVASSETRHLGEYEVVFAVESSEPELPASAKANDSAPPAKAVDRFSSEVADLKKQLDHIQRTLARSSFSTLQWRGYSAEAPDAYARLITNEISPDLARDIVERAEARAAGPESRNALPHGRASEPPPRGSPRRTDRETFERALAEELATRFKTQPALGRGDARPRIAALIGPPGAGKTTTLVKLAVKYGLTSPRPTLLLSIDSQRIAAAEQLSAFAGILGVAFQMVSTVAGLAQTIEENRGKDLILIDTPGFGFADLESSSGLAHFLSTRPDIGTQLVAPASMKPGDLTRVIDGFEPFQPQRLLFTRLDETSALGPIFNEAVRTGKPLSFFGNGQQIPEDLEEASPERLVQTILGGRSSRVEAA
jgi:flagellar biosynthesis protein FlhF